MVKLRLTASIPGLGRLELGTLANLADSCPVTVTLYPPTKPLFDQLERLLMEKSLERPLELHTYPDSIGQAATALCLRWGTYLSTLFDHDKPLWEGVRAPNLSRISDEEMARVNIEASSALEKLIETRLHYPNLYWSLLTRANACLPCPKADAHSQMTRFKALSSPEMAEAVLHADPQSMAKLLTEVERYPTRVFANALINTAWRNGPIEDFHAGESVPLPIDKRRFTVEEEQQIFSEVAGRMAVGMEVLAELLAADDARTWPEKVLPCKLDRYLAPTGWSLTKESREIELHLP